MLFLGRESVGMLTYRRDSEPTPVVAPPTKFFTPQAVKKSPSEGGIVTGSPSSLVIWLKEEAHQSEAADPAA